MRSKISRVNGQIKHGTWDWFLPRTDVPWSDLTEADLEPQGDAEFTRHVRTDRGLERHLGLQVRGETVDTLGMLAIRCTGRNEDTEEPVTLSIADQPVIINQADGAS